MSKDKWALVRADSLSPSERFVSVSGNQFTMRGPAVADGYLLANIEPDGAGVLVACGDMVMRGWPTHADWMARARELESEIVSLRRLRETALARVDACRAQEVKFGRAWEHRERHPLGPPQALVEAWTEWRTWQAVLDIIDGGKS